MNIGFIISYNRNFIGGHKISTSEIADSFIKYKNNVYIFCDIQEFDKKLYNNKIKLIQLKYITNNIKYMTKIFTLFNYIYRNIMMIYFLKKFKIDIIIFTDLRAKYSCYFSSLLFSNLKRIYIQYGGKVVKRRVLPYLDYISTSKEWYDYFYKKTKRIKYIPGQINIEKYNSLKNYYKNIKNILIIMRMDEGYLDIWNNIAYEINLIEGYNVNIVGGGTNEKEIKKLFNCNRNKINFLGIIQIKPSIIVNNDILIGQGRTSIEGLLTETPTYIPGKIKNNILVTKQNLLRIKSSNFTTRNINKYISLKEIISNKYYIIKYYKESIYIKNKLIEWYSSENMVNYILKIRR